jgi:hypothetical protein
MAKGVSNGFGGSEERLTFNVREELGGEVCDACVNLCIAGRNTYTKQIISHLPSPGCKKETHCPQDTAACSQAARSHNQTARIQSE